MTEVCNKDITVFLSCGRTQAELCEFYGVSRRTLRSWCRAAGIEELLRGPGQGYLIPPVQLQKIIDEIGPA